MVIRPHEKPECSLQQDYQDAGQPVRHSHGRRWPCSNFGTKVEARQSEKNPSGAVAIRGLDTQHAAGSTRFASIGIDGTLVLIPHRSKGD